MSLLSACCERAAAVDIHWTNPLGGNWGDASNWTPAAVPGPTDNALIDLAGSYTVTLDVDADVNSLAIGAGGGTQIFTLSGARLLRLANNSNIGSNGRLVIPVTTVLTVDIPTGITLLINSTAANAYVCDGQLIVIGGGSVLLETAMSGFGKLTAKGSTVVVDIGGNAGGVEVLPGSDSFFDVDGAALEIGTDDLLITGGIASIFNTSTLEVDVITVCPDPNVVSAIAVLDVEAGSLITGTQGGQTTVNVCDGGVVRGDGIIDGVINNGGTLGPGASPGSIVVGEYAPTRSGTLQIELGGTVPGTEHDRLVVTDPSTLDGTLALTTYGGYQPQPGEFYDVVTANTTAGGALLGRFDSISHPMLTGDTVLQVDYYGTHVRVQARPACNLAPGTTRVSLSSGGGQVIGGPSTAHQLSRDGRWLILRSGGANLVPGDTNALFDVFVRDLFTGQNERVNVSSAAAQATGGDSGGASISDHGNIVAFVSSATNLVPGDTNGAADVFIRARDSGTTTRVLGPGGVQPNGDAFDTAISGNGRYVAFVSEATNLVASDGNAVRDVFLYDLLTGQVELVSRTSGGASGNGQSSGPSVSGDGQLIAFQSSASNLVAGDTNGAADVFVFDRTAGTVSRVSLSSAGVQGNNASTEAALSEDGRFCAFSSLATNLVGADTNGVRDVFVRELLTAQTERVSLATGAAQADGASRAPCISLDGSLVLFESDATNLVSGDTNALTDVFLRDRGSGQTERISVDSAGAQATGGASNTPPRGAIAADGRLLLFNSSAGNLVSSDSNAQSDAFIRNRGGPVAIPGDLNADGDVDQGDLAELLADYGCTGGGCGGDVDGDGNTGQPDLAALLSNYGYSCP